MTNDNSPKYVYPEDYKARLLATCCDALIVKDLNAGRGVGHELHDLIEKERQSIDLKALKSEDGSDAFMHAEAARDRIVALEALADEFDDHRQAWAVKQKSALLPMEGRQPNKLNELRS